MSYMSVSMGHRQRGRLPVEQTGAIVYEVAEALALPPSDLSFVDGGAVGSIAVERSAFSLMIHEILDNAKKFHPRQRPRIECRVEARRPDRIRIRVADDGVNLSPVQLERAFRPFDQGEKYATGETPGIGLGLPLVRSLAWQLGGDVRLLNREDGPGVVVEIELPSVP